MVSCSFSLSKVGVTRNKKRKANVIHLLYNICYIIYRILYIVKKESIRNLCIIFTSWKSVILKLTHIFPLVIDIEKQLFCKICESYCLEANREISKIKHKFSEKWWY